MNEKRIGIYGATGSYDFGDYAMLINNIEDFFRLDKNLTVVVFTPNVICTKEILKNNFDNEKLKKIDVVYDGSDCLGLRRLSKIFKKLSIGLENIFFYWCWQRSLSGDESIIDSLLFKKLIKNIKSIDVLVFNGGGYLQNGWGNYNIWFAHIINLANLYGKKIFFMANSIGPINEQNCYVLGQSLKKIERFIVRDGKNYSLKLLEQLGVSEKSLVRTDDLMLIPSFAPPRNIRKYVCVEIMLWIERCKNGKTYILDIFVEFINYVIALGYNVVLVNLDMTDYKTEECILYIKRKVLNTDCLLEVSNVLNIKEVYTYYENAVFSVSMRYHPVIFSLRNDVPCCGIICDNDGYYEGKMKGAFESLGMEPDNVLHINDLSYEFLKNAFDDRLNKRYSLNLINTFKKSRDKYLKEILVTSV